MGFLIWGMIPFMGGDSTSTGRNLAYRRSQQDRKLILTRFRQKYPISNMGGIIILGCATVTLVQKVQGGATHAPYLMEKLTDDHQLNIQKADHIPSNPHQRRKESTLEALDVSLELSTHLGSLHARCVNLNWVGGKYFLCASLAGVAAGRCVTRCVYE